MLVIQFMDICSCSVYFPAELWPQTLLSFTDSGMLYIASTVRWVGEQTTAELHVGRLTNYERDSSGNKTLNIKNIHRHL